MAGPLLYSMYGRLEPQEMSVATARFMPWFKRVLRLMFRALWNLTGGDALQSSGRSLNRQGKTMVRSQELDIMLMLTLTQKFDFLNHVICMFQC